MPYVLWLGEWELDEPKIVGNHLYYYALNKDPRKDEDGIFIKWLCIVNVRTKKLIKRVKVDHWGVEFSKTV